MSWVVIGNSVKTGGRVLEPPQAVPAPGGSLSSGQCTASQEVLGLLERVEAFVAGQAGDEAAATAVAAARQVRD
jgi:hypothetical protein